jgi:hypothetical protein
MYYDKNLNLLNLNIEMTWMITGIMIMMPGPLLLLVVLQVRVSLRVLA